MKVQFQSDQVNNFTETENSFQPSSPDSPGQSKPEIYGSAGVKMFSLLSKKSEVVYFGVKILSFVYFGVKNLELVSVG